MNQRSDENEDLLGRISRDVALFIVVAPTAFCPATLLLYYTNTHNEGHETRSTDKIGSVTAIAFLPENSTCVGTDASGGGIKYTSRTCTNRVDKEYLLLYMMEKEGEQTDAPLSPASQVQMVPFVFFHRFIISL